MDTACSGAAHTTQAMTTSTSMPGPGRTTARRCRSSSSALSTKRYRPRSPAGLPPDGCSTSGPAPGAGSIVWDKDGRGWRHRPRPVCRDVERRPPGQSPAQPRPWERRSTALPNESFDLVTSTLSFRHWSDHPKALSEVRRVLRHGGALAPAAGPIRGREEVGASDPVGGTRGPATGKWFIAFQRGPAPRRAVDQGPRREDECTSCLRREPKNKWRLRLTRPYCPKPSRWSTPSMPCRSPTAASTWSAGASSPNRRATGPARRPLSIGQGVCCSWASNASTGPGPNGLPTWWRGVAAVRPLGTSATPNMLVVAPA